MRFGWALVAFFTSLSAVAQDKPASKKKKPVAAKKDVQKKQELSKARPQATPEQIRRFNELQKKQQAGR